jgi:hypothetical protein
VNLDLFFKREEVASAFLATLLQECPEVRDVFFGELSDRTGDELAEILKKQLWGVAVEEHQVDIRMESRLNAEDWVVLVENKIQGSSRQPGQLLRYYSSQVKAEPKKRVIAAYLAPDGIGQSEVDKVETSELFQTRKQRTPDYVGLVSWETVLTALHGLRTGKPEAFFIQAGAAGIRKTIEEARKGYDTSGGRGKILRLLSDIRDRLKNMFPVKLGHPFPGQDQFILALGTTVTLWLMFRFEAQKEPPYQPTNLFTGENMHLTLRARLKLSERARRIPELKARWDELEKAGRFEIANVGGLALEDRHWFSYERPFDAPPVEICHEVTKLVSAVIEWILGFSGQAAGASSQCVEERGWSVNRKESPEQRPGQWAWHKDEVGPREEHFELRYGIAENSGWDKWLPVARVGHPVGQSFPVQFLLDSSPSNQPMLAAAIKELDFYLVELGKPDPWRYAKYHCETCANAYSSVHWSFLGAYSGEVVR